MATYSRGIVVFGIGMMMMLLFCFMMMRVTVANDDDSGFDDSSDPYIHAISREDKKHNHHGGCHSNSLGTGEECTSEDDHLGLYADVDDTFKVLNPHKGKHHFGQHFDADDSPDIAHNHVNVLGH